MISTTKSWPVALDVSTSAEKGWDAHANTGCWGRGFIGHALVAALHKSGHGVTVVGRSAKALRPLPDGVVYLSGQLEDAAFLRSVGRECRQC